MVCFGDGGGDAMCGRHIMSAQQSFVMSGWVCFGFCGGLTCGYLWSIICKFGHSLCPIILLSHLYH